MSTEQLLKNFYAALNLADLNKLHALFNEDAVYEDPAANEAIKGKKAIEENSKEFFSAFKDIKFDIKSLFSNNDHACAEWIMSGINTGAMPGKPATGKSFSIRGVSVFEIKGDKISRHSVYFDQMNLMRQLGVVS